MKITNQIRMAVIFCSAVIILFSLAMAFDFVLKSFQSFSGKEQIVNQVLLLLCGSFILYVISVYSRQKGLTNLAGSFISLLILNIISSVFNIVHQLGYFHLNYKALGGIYGFFGLIRFILYIVILISATNSMSLQIKGIKAINQYAIACLVAIIVSYFGTRIIVNMGQIAYTSLISIFYAIPYIFILRFAMQIKEDTL